MKIRNLCALLLALMLLALAGCGQKEQPTQPENPDVPQEEAAAPVRLVCSNGSTTLRFSREEDGHWLWADDKTFPLDESYALTLLETVQGIEHLSPVTNSAQLADYGLESSAKYVTPVSYTHLHRHHRRGPRRNRQDLSGGGGGGGRLPGQAGQPHHPDPPRRGGRGAAGLPARRPAEQGGPLSAAVVRRPV